MLRGFWENHRFLTVYLGKFVHSFQAFAKCLFYIIVELLGDGYKWKSITCKSLVHTRNISNIFSHKKWLKFNFPFISKFWFNWDNGKMLKDTDLKVTQISYVRDTATIVT